MFLILFVSGAYCGSEKDRKEAAFEAELERVHAQKEQEIGRLRAAQERASDQQAELDSLRAKRTQEAGERKWREQQKVYSNITRCCLTLCF